MSIMALKSAFNIRVNEQRVHFCSGCSGIFLL